MAGITKVERRRRNHEKALERMEILKKTINKNSIKSNISDDYIRIAPMFVTSTIESFKDKDDDEIINGVVNLNNVAGMRRNGDVDLEGNYDYYEIIFSFTGGEEEIWSYPDKLIRDSDYMTLISKFKIDY